MLKIENLKKSYGDFKLDLSMKVNKGAVTGVVGSNGSGKTTTFKAILNLIKIDEGRIELFGEDSLKISEKEKQDIGVVFSDSTFRRSLTIKDIIPILKAFYKNFDEAYYMDFINRNKLPLNKKIKDFSTGMTAKFKLINALAHKPKFLILDEPTAGLDVIARGELLEIIREYLEEDEDNSVLISSHISKDLESLCDDFYLIKNGKILLHEETDILLSNYGLIKTNEEEKIDEKYVIKKIKDKMGIIYLTNERQFYLENYHKLIVEKAGIDEIVMYLGGN